jgi:hypothetical protein
MRWKKNQACELMVLNLQIILLHGLKIKCSEMVMNGLEIKD